MQEIQQPVQQRCPGFIVPLNKIEYWVYVDLATIYPKPCSIYSRGTIGLRVGGLEFSGLRFRWLLGLQG